MITWKSTTSTAVAAKTMSRTARAVRARLCGMLIKLRRTSCARSATRTLRTRTTLTKYELDSSLHCDLLLMASQHQQVHLPRDKECYGCYRNFPTLPAMMIHLESGNCSSQVTNDDIDNWTLQYSQLNRYIDPQAANRYECPRCENQFSYLSGLLQHLESDACDGSIGKSLRTLPKFLAKKVSHQDSY